MKIAVVSFADEAQWYRKGQIRLKQELLAHNYSGSFHLYQNHEQLGCMPHKSVQYGFKPFAIKKALEAEKVDILFWLDSSQVCIKDPQPAFDYVQENGWLFEMCGWSIADTTSDRCFELLGKNRDDYRQAPEFSANFLGFNLHNEKSVEYLRRWLEYASLPVDKNPFVGPWTNKHGEASVEKNVIGHRHDQSVGSIIATDLDMKIIPPTYMEYWSENPREHCCFLCRHGADL